MLAVHRLYLAVALAVLKVASAEQHAHRGAVQFGNALRIQTPPTTAPSKDVENAKPSKDADKAKDKVKFQMPTYQHADSLSAATNGVLDWFVVCYWATIVAILAGFEVVMHLHGARAGSKLLEKTDDALPNSGDSEESPPVLPPVEDSSPKLARAHTNTSIFLDEGGPSVHRELSPNIFALNLIASCGKAQDRQGNKLSPLFVFCAGFIMGLLQLLTLLLVVYDIDPSASPYTEKPSAAWKTSALTVNCMKVIMVFFLGMYVVSEAADAYDNYLLGVAVEESELLVHKFFVLFTPMYHYFITLSVVLAGVSVVLSCQDVPNILYNSMAILFITRVDELFWGFFERTFDIEAQWVVEINECNSIEVQLFKKCIIMFPMMWGFCLLGRAWYRDQMPALVMRIHLS